MIRRLSAICLTIALSLTTALAQVGPLPGSGPLPLFVSLPVTKGFGASASPQGGATSYSFTSQAYGLAASNTRRVIACINAVSTVAQQAVSSLTIGGVSASLITDGTHTAAINTTSGSAWMESECWIANVTSATSGTVAFTMSNAQVRASIATWSVDNLSNTATSTSVLTSGNTSNANPSGSINVTGNGALIGFCGEASNGANFTWTNLNSDFSANNGTNGINYSGASNTFATTQSGLTVTCTPSSFGGVGQAMALAAFR